MTKAEARFNNSLRPRKPEGSLGRTAQDGHLDSHTAPELCTKIDILTLYDVLESPKKEGIQHFTCSQNAIILQQCCLQIRAGS